MQAQAPGTVWRTTSWFANFIGILAVLLVLSVLTSTATGVIGDRWAFIALTAIGFSMCALGGIGPSQARLGWTHAITVLGSVLGAVALGLVVAVFGGWIADRAAVLAMAGLLALKWIVAQLFVR
jgi:hypothetical protein